MNAPQLPLALRFPPDQRFETFLGAPAACDALRALTRGAAQDSLFVCGPGASGKSHLLLATAAHAAEVGTAVAYLPLRGARGRLRALLEAQERAVTLIALDDVDAIAGEREDEIALFDLHNRARDAGRVLLYAASQPPAALPLDLPDLRSRLAQCVQLRLASPDEAARRAILSQRAARRGLRLDPQALEFLMRRASRDLRSLLDLLDRIDRAALAAQRRPTVPFLRNLLGDAPTP